MNNKVSIRPQNFIPYTLVPNAFIDEFLGKANGEFLKVYLILLRYMSSGAYQLDLDQIADILLMTESDVLRGLKYFQKEGLLTLHFNGRELKEIQFTQLNPTSPDNQPTIKHNTESSFEPAENYDHYAPQHEAPVEEPKVPMQPESSMSHLRVISQKPDYSNAQIADFSRQDDFTQLFYITQKLLGKTLSNYETQTLISLNDWLGLPIDVIELLVEYCADNDHRSIRYIEKVAVDWADNGINTLEKARVRTETYKKSYFVILKAYGITDRSPTPNQIAMMDKWLNTYHLDISLIVEACERTISQINKAEMRYTDSILNTWYKNGVRTLQDVTQLDSSYQQISQKRPEPKKQRAAGHFNNYDQRSYDYDELEKKALEMRLGNSKGKRYSS